MLTSTIAVIGCAVLFALFAAFRPRPRCHSNCSACTTVCSQRELQDSNE